MKRLKQELKRAKKLKIKIMSGSMSPVLKTDEILEVSWIPKNFEPQKYDIFVYWDGMRLIGHYFYEKANLLNDQNEVWIFKCLIAKSEDFPVARKEVIGIVNKKIPFLRRLFLSLRS